MAGFELHTRDDHPESGSGGAFEYVADDDLVPFTRHNWKWV